MTTSGKILFFRTANSINLFFKQMYEDQTKEFRILGLKEFVGRGPVISAKEID